MGDDTPLAVLSEQLPRPASLLPAEFQPGDQPADRLPARDAGDDAEDAARQSRQHPRRGREPVPPAAARLARCSRTPSSRRCAPTWATTAADDRLHLRCQEGRRRACATRSRRIRQEAEDAVRGGAQHLVLSDEGYGAERAAIPMILATGAVHSHLVRQQLRTFMLAQRALAPSAWTCIISRVLIGVGATTVNAYLAQETHRRPPPARSLRRRLPSRRCCSRYKDAVDQGLLKIMSKMGIAVISSYRGGYNFEALGLSRSLVAEFFPGMPSRISGIGLDGIQHKVLELHERAYAEDFAGTAHRRLLQATAAAARATPTRARSSTRCRPRSPPIPTPPTRRYSEALRSCRRSRSATSSTSRPRGQPVSVDEVESITEIRKRFVTPGMSLGALGPEAHETLNIAMNRIGAKSDSGEGGEDPARFKPTAERRQSPTRRSSRSPRAASASPPSTSTTAASSRSRSPRAPSPARAASSPASR